MSRLPALIALVAVLAACSSGDDQSPSSPPGVPRLELLAQAIDVPPGIVCTSTITDIAVDAASNVYVANTCTTVIRKVTPSGDVASIGAGPTPPAAVALDGSGALYLAINDTFGGGSGVVFTLGSIRRITPDGALTTVATNLPTINAMTMGPDGVLYVSSGSCNQAVGPCTTSIDKVTVTGQRSTIFTQQDTLVHQDALAIDAQGNIYAADPAAHTVNKITPGGDVSVIAGSRDHAGSADGVGAAARFRAPDGVALDPSGNLHVADTGNHTLRKIAPNGNVTTIAGTAGQPGLVLGPLPGLLRSPRRLVVSGSDLFVALDTAVVVIRNRP